MSNTFLNSKYASSFSPANLSGLAVWLSADDSNSVTQSAGVVSSWTDRSPNALNMSQATVGSRPTIESNVQNGRPALRFTTTQMLQSTANLTLAPDQTWFLSFRPLATGNIFFIEQGPNTNSTAGGFHYGGNFDLFGLNRNATTRFVFDGTRGSTLFSVGTWYVTSFVNSNRSTASTDVLWSINGTARTTGYNGNTLMTGNATNLLYINPTSRVPGSNYMGEIIIYNRALTRGEVLLVERYLSYKWGVTLPTAHPFSSTPAAMRLFNPLDISGLSAWFDAADTRRMTLSGSNVNSWGDKANLDNSMNFVGTAGTLVSNASNYPCVRFSGTSRYQSTLSNLTRAAYFSDVSTFTMFATVNTSSTSGVNGSFWNFVSTTNVANRVDIFTTPPSTLFWDGGQLANPRQTGLTLTPNSVRLYMFRRSGLTLSFREFGTLTTSNFAATAATIANESYRITMSESGAAWTGDMHEILWYNRALPDTDIWRLEVYLAEKWGLRSSLTTNVPPRFTRALSPVFTPVLISNCVLWLDAADRSTLTLSGTSNVTGWRDKSGLANNATSPTTDYPTYQSNTSTLCNQPTVSFVGYNNVLKVNSNFNMTTYPSLCYFIVIRPASTQPNATYAGILSTDAPGLYGRSLGFGSGNWQEEYYSSFRNITPYTSNVWTIVSLQFAGTTSATLAVNGVTFAGTATGTANNTNGLHIGTYNADGGGYYYFGSDFETAEILIYGTNLTTAQRQTIEAYLAWKWGLVGNLSNNHPYKTTPV
jgi:hypothetical protein